MFTTASNSLMQLFSIVGKIDGKIKLQKIVFILQEKKLIDFELGYKYALYGPYSEDLQVEIEYLARVGFLSETLTDDGYTYEINNSFPIKIKIDNEIAKHSDLIKNLLGKESQLLEVTSTIYYLKSHQYEEKEAIEKKIKLLKPNLEDRIAPAFEFYSSLEQVN